MTHPMSPVLINLLFHVYARPVAFDKYLVVDGFINSLVAYDLVVKSETNPCGYDLTNRGSVYVDMILKTPLPEYGDLRKSL